VLDRFEVRMGSQPLERMNRGAAHDLFCFLLIFRNRRHSRDALAELLSAGDAPAASRKRVRQALWQLQGALGHRADVLSVEPASVAYEHADWLDADAFEDAYVHTAAPGSGDLDRAGAEEAAVAVRLHGVGLLPGSYHDWCAVERERLRAMYLAMLVKLMDYCEHEGDYHASISYGEQILRDDVAHELTHRRLMWLRYLLGDRTAALRQYHRCVAAMDEELGVPVSHATRGLFQLISDDEMASEPHGALARHEYQHSLHELSARIAEMRTLLQRCEAELEAATVDLASLRSTAGISSP
jgi:DNA-binding SARP family transcriptional activator